ncbi:hypothetical protein ACTWP4_18650 [Gracilibacillus sp. D59]|uniref:hypothetical protein n=1 Tax=Gracilibacillus sp. D59 TaxID=3457434 RepID=UPI003FCEBFF6
MKIQNKDLRLIYDDVRNEIETKLKNSENLSYVKSVIYGQRKKIGSLMTPTIWIVPNAYNPQHTGGHSADHDIPFDLVGFVKHTDPEQGLKDAQDLALDIYDALVSDRTLNGLASDFRPTRVDPAYEAQGANNLFFSAVQFTCKIKRREQ